MLSTFESKKLFLIEIKSLQPSFKFKFIQKKVKFADLIEIQANGAFFKYKVKIELEKLVICPSFNKYTEMVLIFWNQYKNLISFWISCLI